MKILLIMDPGISIPPPLYGGHERLVFMFAQEYARLGHEVSLLAGPDSEINGKTYTFGINKRQRSKLQRMKELFFAWNFLIRKRKTYDLIHNFGRLLYFLPILNTDTKKIMTYGRPVAQQGIMLFNRFPNKNIIFTACSNYCVSTGNVDGIWKTIYNAIDFSKYQVKATVSVNAPLMFLGRLDRIKGLQTAINVAIATGNQLIIGGNEPDTKDNKEYFKNFLKPKFDGKQIVYLGPLNDEKKSNYLSTAKALLFPIEWDEPFGMVMVEAMACGTPVIAFKRGSVPEIVEEGITGFIVNTSQEMENAVAKINEIDREKCNQHAKSRFDIGKIAQDYLSL